MKNTLFALSLILAGLLLGGEKINAQQTGGTLTFSVTTTEPAGNYNNVNVLAIWITDNSNNFIKTKMRRAQSHINSLPQWVSNSSQNVTDAVTGATLTSHGTRTINWNGTDITGAVANDGTYRVWVEMSDKNVGSYYTYVEFTKGPANVTLNPANISYFTGISLAWVASSGVEEGDHSGVQFNCAPNPVNENSRITFSLKRRSDVTITLHDMSGKNLALLADGNYESGSYSLALSDAQVPALSAGVYFLRINTGYMTSVKKIVIN